MTVALSFIFFFPLFLLPVVEILAGLKPIGGKLFNSAYDVRRPCADTIKQVGKQSPEPLAEGTFWLHLNPPVDQDFSSEVHVGNSAAGFYIIENDGETMTRAFR